MSKKKIIRDNVGSVTPLDIDGSLKHLRERVNQLIAVHGENARLDWNPRFYYDYDTEPSPRFEIYVDREETDAEYNKRIEQTKADNAAREAREKAEFERLAKKYGAK